MTEAEAKLTLEVRISRFDHAGDVNEALEIAKKALDEIQQYREIRTVEECREAMGKRDPKKVTDLHVDDFICPTCGYEETTIDYKQVPKYCRNCGQALYD